MTHITALTIVASALIVSAPPSDAPPKFIRIATTQDEVSEYSQVVRQTLIEAKTLKDIEALVNQWTDSTSMDKKAFLHFVQSQREIASKAFPLKSIEPVIEANRAAVLKSARLERDNKNLQERYDNLNKKYNDLRLHR
jgi:hypothetical protein